MPENTPLSDDLSELTRQIQRLVRSQSYLHSFMRGVFSGLGNVIGATLVVAVILWLLSQIQIVPILGSWVADIVDSAQSKLLTR